MKISKWFIAETPFLVLLTFLIMGIFVEVRQNRIDLFTANIPLITMMITYLILRRRY